MDHESRRRSLALPCPLSALLIAYRTGCRLQARARSGLRLAHKVEKRKTVVLTNGKRGAGKSVLGMTSTSSLVLLMLTLRALLRRVPRAADRTGKQGEGRRRGEGGEGRGMSCTSTHVNVWSVRLLRVILLPCEGSLIDDKLRKSSRNTAVSFSRA